MIHVDVKHPVEEEEEEEDPRSSLVQWFQSLSGRSGEFQLVPGLTVRSSRQSSASQLPFGSLLRGRVESGFICLSTLKQDLLRQPTNGSDLKGGRVGVGGGGGGGGGLLKALTIVLTLTYKDIYIYLRRDTTLQM